MKPDRDSTLLQRFASSFVRLDDLEWWRDEPLPDVMAASSSVGPYTKWRPAHIQTDEDALTDIRHGRPLPELFELFATSYRWFEVDLGVCCLLPNPPAVDLKPLADEMFKDPVLNNTLLPAGFVRFATGPFSSYDPICFNLSQMVDGDCPIVRMNHESILSHDELGHVTTIFDSFRQLVIAVIESADSTQPPNAR